MVRIYSRILQKDPHDPDNHDDVITHLESDILECKVKWALGSISKHKASGGDGIPAKLFHGDCSHEIKRCLLFGRKAMANLDSILKRDGKNTQNYTKKIFTTQIITMV